jgi:hypothetical protein
MAPIRMGPIGMARIGMARIRENPGERRRVAAHKHKIKSRPQNMRAGGWTNQEWTDEHGYFA